MENNICFVCRSKADVKHVHDPVKYFYSCPVCGRYEYYVIFGELTDFNLNHLAAYLAYNGFKSSFSEYRFFTTMSKEECDKRKERFDKGEKSLGHPVRLEIEDVENWYPKTFSEKVDHILLYLNSRIQHFGQEVILTGSELFSCFFVDYYDYTNDQCLNRDYDSIVEQAEYMINYLKEQQLIETVYVGSVYSSEYSGSNGYGESIKITPKGYARIDELQKYNTTGKNAFVAMQFGDDTKELREAIRKGIKQAGYNAILIDEVEHNNFITPEIMKYIKDSKFLVVDLTHQNNGAYFEEGYAMGLGKPVIQLCKDGVKLHFDIAQKNTIMWKTEEEITVKLKNRIKATID